MFRSRSVKALDHTVHGHLILSALIKWQADHLNKFQKDSTSKTRYNEIDIFGEMSNEVQEDRSHIAKYSKKYLTSVSIRMGIILTSFQWKDCELPTRIYGDAGSSFCRVFPIR